MSCSFCSIIPNDVLQRLSQDPALPDDVRTGLANAAMIDLQMRLVREQARKMTSLTSSLAPPMQVAAKPTVSVYNCANGTVLPGAPVPKPETSTDATAKRTAVETRAVADFYALFGRNSIDGCGMTLISSVHYGSNFNNAFWNGTQMTYGDGDNRIFIDFTKSNDVIAHELTHGLTQHTLQLLYANEPGGLNESMSDVFGSMFRQWRANQTVDKADWLIGKDIMGPLAKSKGFTCLRDMADPPNKHCLAPQPKHFKDYKTGMDPHESSGIPNFAFYTTAKAIGGKSWEKAGKIWYEAMSQAGPKPNLKMKAFANMTRKAAKLLFPKDAKVIASVEQGWKAVGL